MLKIKIYMLKNHNLIYALFLWIILCASINAYPKPIGDFFINYNNLNYLEKNSTFYFTTIKNIINFFRVYLPFFLILTTVIIIFYKRKKLNKNNFFIIFLLYIFFQAIGTALNNDRSFLFEKIQLLLNAAHIVIATYLFFLFKLEKFLNLLLIITIFLIFIIVKTHLYYIIIEFLNVPYQKYLYGSQTWQETFLDNAFIRVTGLSRSLILVIILLFFLLYQKKNNFLIRNLFGFFFFISFFYIYWLQSRTAIYLAPLIIIISSFLIYKKNKILPIKSFAFIILCFLLSFFLINAIHKYKINLSVIETKKQEKQGIHYNDKNRLLIKDNISSSRFFIWEEIRQNYDYSKIFGYGLQGDRFYFGKTFVTSGYNFYNNSSNAFIYSFITAGYFGIFFFILINVYILSKIYLIFKKKKIDKHSLYLNTAIVSILFLMIRNIVENNYAVFGTDMAFFLIYSSIIIHESKKI